MSQLFHTLYKGPKIPLPKLQKPLQSEESKKGVVLVKISDVILAICKRIETGEGFKKRDMLAFAQIDNLQEKLLNHMRLQKTDLCLKLLQKVRDFTSEPMDLNQLKETDRMNPLQIFCKPLGSGQLDADVLTQVNSMIADLEKKSSVEQSLHTTSAKQTFLSPSTLTLPEDDPFPRSSISLQNLEIYKQKEGP